MLKQWPFLAKMEKDKRLAYVDLALAQMLLKEGPEEAACFLCHLSLAVRKGHLCIYAKSDTICPTAEELWLPAKEESPADILNSGDLEKLNTFILKGSTLLPQSLVTDMEINTHSSTPLCQEKGRYYFHRFWVKETQLIADFCNVLCSKPEFAIEATQEIQSLLECRIILPEQAQAISKACANSATLICGGPGTGKTYTAAHLIKVLWNALQDDQKKRFEIALAAPTGKAAANLQKSLSSVIEDLDGIKTIKAKTLHHLLGIHRRKENQRNLSADLVVVDECSMIDIDLMAALLKAIKPGSRLILLGDPNQLPSVEAGGVFSDFVHYLNQAQGPCHPALLKTCLRSDLHTIVQFAQKIQENSKPDFSGAVEQREIGPHFKTELLERAATHFEVSCEEPKEMMEAFNRYRILSPFRKGPYGVDGINELLCRFFENKAKKNGWIIAPIILTKNDSSFELFNGETGILIRKSAQEGSFQTGDYALFPGDKPDTFKSIPAVLLPSFAYAYCISVHKSQGSEFDHVHLVLPEGSEIFGSEMLYTAVTRARKHLEIWCSIETLNKTLEHRSYRLSGIRERCLSPCPCNGIRLA